VKEGKEATANQDPALVYNRQLLKKYDNELAAFTSEMGKYEAKEGDAQKAMDELQKKMQELSNEPKKSQ
jgi:Flp pilus assembly protein TadD